jgi:hypothetical protein
MFSKKTRDFLVVAGVVTLGVFLWSRRTKGGSPSAGGSQVKTNQPPVLYNTASGQIVVAQPVQTQATL